MFRVSFDYMVLIRKAINRKLSIYNIGQYYEYRTEAKSEF